MERLVPLVDQRRMRRGLIRLGEVPSLFSEGVEEDPCQWLGLRSFDEWRARLGQMFLANAD